MRTIISDCSDAVKSEIEQLLQDLNKRINRRVARLNRRIELLGDLAHFSGEVDLSQVFERLRITFADALKDIVETVLVLGPLLLIPAIGEILAAAAVIIGLAKKLWDWFSRRPESAQTQRPRKSSGGVGEAV